PCGEEIDRQWQEVRPPVPQQPPSGDVTPAGKKCVGRLGGTCTQSLRLRWSWAVLDCTRAGASAHSPPPRIVRASNLVARQAQLAQDFVAVFVQPGCATA